MLVKIGDKVFNPEDQPIMVILNDEDKYNIGHMVANQYKYCSYNPDTHTPEEISNWIKEDIKSL